MVSGKLDSQDRHAGGPQRGLSRVHYRWYGLVRNGLQLFYDDLKAARESDDDLDELLETMEDHERMLENWKGDWMVSGQTPESLYMEFWGGDYEGKVRKAWKSLDKQMEKARGILQPYAELYTKQKGKGKRSVFLKKLALKLRYIGMRKKHVDPLIKVEIPKKLAEIEKKTQEAWNEKRESHRDSPVDYGAVRHVAICHLLVPIAIRTSAVMDDLRESCRSMAGDLTTELELDLFCASQRQPALRGAATARQKAEYPNRIIVAAA